MSFQFKSGMLYRMPVSFGPSAGPRQGVNGERYECRDTPAKHIAAVSFLSDAAALDALLPPGFTLHGEPVVTVEVSYFKEIEWLAGRGYNTLGVRFPARYQGKRDEAVGSFLSVLWENLTDPILTGRDELGYAKIYCDIPEPRILNGERVYGGSWFDHRFLDLRLSKMAEVAPASLAPAPGTRNDGLLHFKYIPRTGSPAEADIAHAALSLTASHTKVVKAWRGQGSVAFHRSSFEQLPTMQHIVNTLAALPIVELRGATIVEARGGKDFSDQRMLL